MRTAKLKHLATWLASGGIRAPELSNQAGHFPRPRALAAINVLEKDARWKRSIEAQKARHLSALIHVYNLFPLERVTKVQLHAVFAKK